MVEEAKADALTTAEGGKVSSPESQAPARVLTATLADALSKVADPGAKAMLSVALSRTTLGFGPDPDTAKILAESEMHEEDCRLKGYQFSLENKDKQNGRDHDYRKKKLNHQSMMTAAVPAVAVAGIGGGLYLSVSGSSSIGNPVLVASFTVLSSLAGKLLSSKDKD